MVGNSKGQSRFETVDDAIRAGKTHLEVWCERCRVIRHIPWRLLRGAMGTDRLQDVAERLVCEKCGDRPDPGRVKPRAPSDAPGFACKVY
jgi:hypothetical protein